MEKSIERDISFVLDARTVPAAGMKLKLVASDKERALLAQRFEIPEVKSLAATVVLKKKEDVIELSGSLKATVVQVCVVSLDPFENEANASFEMLFSTVAQPTVNQSVLDVDMEAEPVEFLPRGQIFFKEIIAEEFGLNLDPFPKKTSELFEYREAPDKSEKTNPFAVLKRLTKSE